jgi:hypothetical protein
MSHHRTRSTHGSDTYPKEPLRTYHSLTSWTVAICMTVHFLLGLYAFIVRTSSDSYSISTGSTSWFVISNSAWIGLYAVCLAASVCTCWLCLDSIYLYYAIMASLSRTVCLISIVSAHASSTTLFKIDEFYMYSILFGFVLEPLFLVIMYLFDMRVYVHKH